MLVMRAMPSIGRCPAARVVSVLVLAVVVATGTPRGGQGALARVGCGAVELHRNYARHVESVLRTRTDAWGNELLRMTSGPTYRGASGFLAPLLYAGGPKGTRLTESGVYYL